jgi:hypothetical protein
MAMDYNKLFEDALSNILKDYSESKLRFFSERDLQGHLFYECRRLMEEQDASFPLKIFAEKAVFSKHAKVDLVLGDNEVLVELKLEPDYLGVNKPVVFTTKKEAAGSGSVESDLEKVDDYARRGRFAHFVMIDEDGRHVRKICTQYWKSVPIKRERKNKIAHYLHINPNVARGKSITQG